MNHTFPSVSRSALFVLLAAALSPACGGSQPAEPAAPPPAPAASAAPAMAPAPSAAAPAPSAAAPAPAPAAPAAPEQKADEHEGHHHRGMAALFTSSLSELTLKPEQKTTIDAAVAELEKLEGSHKDSGKQLMSDIADGIAAGKIDHAKVDADVKAIQKGMQANAAAVQDNVNKIHKALEPDQRKQLVEKMRAKAQDMHEHMGMMGMHGEHGEHGEHEHGGPGGEHGEHEHGGPPGGGPGGEHGEHGEHGERAGETHEDTPE